MLESISAITLAVTDMARAIRFYERLGFQLRYGGGDGTFASFEVGPNYLNLVQHEAVGWWGRVIFYVSDVDEMHARTVEEGITPLFGPRDAEWGERYFHVLDPDGHELSFAQPTPR